MTCIVGIEKNGEIYMGADSFCGGNYIYTNHAKKIGWTSKVIFGTCGTPRLRDLLENEMGIPERIVGQSLDSYIKGQFIKNLRKCFNENGFLCEKDADEYYGDFLLGIEGKLFRICSDFTVLECAKYGISTGSGCLSAIPILWAHNNIIKPKVTDPKKIILNCLKTAEATTPYVKSPFNVYRMDKKNKVHKI